MNAIVDPQKSTTKAVTRVQNLKKAVQAEEYAVCIERAMLWTQFSKTHGWFGGIPRSGRTGLHPPAHRHARLRRTCPCLHGGSAPGRLTGTALGAGNTSWLCTARPPGRLSR